MNERDTPTAEQMGAVMGFSEEITRKAVVEAFVDLIEACKRDSMFIPTKVCLVCGRDTCVPGCPVARAELALALLAGGWGLTARQRA